MSSIILQGQAIPKSESGVSYLAFEELLGIEYINELFEYHVIVRTTDEYGRPAHGYEGLEGYVSKAHSEQGSSPATHLDMQSLLGQEIGLEFHIDGRFASELVQGLDGGSSDYRHVRYYRGLVSRVEQLNTENRYARYKLTLVPWLWLLTQRSHYKIYQQRSSIEIIRSILQGYPYHTEYRIEGDYPILDYQVQYNESDYHFVTRLMREFGINYYFEHHAEHLVLVLTDSNRYFAQHPHQAYTDLAILPPEQRLPVAEEYIEHFELYEQLVNNKHILEDYHFKTPQNALHSESSAGSQGVLVDLSHYHWHQGQYSQVEGDGAQKVERLYESHVQHGRRAFGYGHLQGLQTGYLFNLKNHPNTDLNHGWIVTGMETHIKDISLGERQSHHLDSVVRFVVQHRDDVIRPLPDYQVYGDTPYPTDRDVLKRYSGLLESEGGSGFAGFVPYYSGLGQRQKRPVARTQTATVVGPVGEEIYTDSYGRVKVKFHWDRYGNQDQQLQVYGTKEYEDVANPEVNTCWLRVSTGWAGSHYGMIHIPRVGQEVIVDFINGDPDMPYVSGRLHNPEQMPLWDLPNQKALSGIKSKEYGGDGSNQLVMDDSQGELQVHLQSSHASSELNLGYITRIEPKVGRRDYRGEGFELRTDGHGVVRADQGLILTSRSNPQGQSQVKELSDTVAQLQQAVAQLEQQLQQAHQHQAEERTLDQTAYPQLKVQYQFVKGESAGEDADKDKVGGAQAGGKRKQSSAKQKTPELSRAELVFSSPYGINGIAQENIHLVSGHHTALTSQGDILQTSQKRIQLTAGEGIRIFSDYQGMKIFSARGKVEMQAQSDNIELIAEQVLKLISAKSKIEIVGAQEVLLSSKGSYIRLDGSGIELGTQQAVRVKTPLFEVLGGKEVSYKFDGTPMVDKYDEQFVLKTLTDEPLFGTPFNIVNNHTNEEFYGVTQEQGETPRMWTEDEQNLKFKVHFLDLIVEDENEENSERE